MDDLIVTASKPSAFDDLLRHLKVDFAIKDLGNLNFFLGVEVFPNSTGLMLSQKRYILDLLRKTKMLEAKPISSPMAQSTSLSAFEGDPLDDTTLYRSTVGALQYLLLVLTSLSQSKNSPSTCIALHLFTSNLSSVFCVILNRPFILVYSSNTLDSILSKPILMLIRLAGVMIDIQLGVFVFL